MELIQEVTGWKPTQPLRVGMERLYNWIDMEVNKHKSKSI